MIRKYMRPGVILLFIMISLMGCESTGYRTSIGVGSGYYHGGMWHDPYYNRPCCQGGGYRPPPAYRPPSFRPPMGGGRPVNLPSMPRPGRF